MWRKIQDELVAWKADPQRRVLLIRGARQVGKTWSVREIGRTFSHFLEVNFEENRDIHAFFKGSLSPGPLCEKLSAFFSVPIRAGRTLVFFDEIQACPDALASLRFFYEKMPDLHVAAAGSLLELALGDVPSLGVGRFSSTFMYPLTFDEFLVAAGQGALREIVAAAGPDCPIDEPFHKRLLDLVRTYLMIGGMPAVVRTYVEKRDLGACSKVLDDLVTGIEDDFGKYKKRSPVARLSEVFRAAAYQAGGKFKYSNVDSPAGGQPLKDALDLLVKAGLVHRIVHTDARGLPLGAQRNERKFKALLFDIGIHQRLMGLDAPAHLTAGEVELVNKGSVAEVFTGLEMIGNQHPHLRPSLHYWHRETRGSNAEVDYVIRRDDAVVPVEVKAGTRGQMQSMRLFMEERGLKRGIRVSSENFSRYGNVESIPLYAAGTLARGDTH